MQQEKISHIVENAVITTLGDMGFIDARSIPGATIDELASTNAAFSIKVLLPCVGKISIATSEDLGRQLVTNIYGDSISNLDEQIIDDSIAEVLNVIAGRIFQELVPDHPFQLGLPSKEDPKNIRDDKASTLLVFKTPDFHTLCITHHIPGS